VQITPNTEVAAERRYDAVEIVPFDPDGYSSAGCHRKKAAYASTSTTFGAVCRGP
jgi:hypothetical protein